MRLEMNIHTEDRIQVSGCYTLNIIAIIDILVI